MEFSAVFAVLGEETPLREDCGQVCGAACCRGASDGEQGMLLFPGEPVPPFGRVLNAAGGRLFVCEESCRRKQRPLACRLFPLFPALDKDGRVRAIYDPRAFRLCPLLREREHIRLERTFVRAVRRSGRLLAADSHCRAFLHSQTEQLREMDRFLRLSDSRPPICR